MGIRIALAGNPNSGKTTLFNSLTGSNQYVGNWPGVTVERKEGSLLSRSDITVTDLPGIYSLSPYTPEEVVARNYLLFEKPDVILNIVDGTNLERNLYLTTQLSELSIPIVIAVNMVDLLQKRGDSIDIKKLSKAFQCKVFEISAMKGTGIETALSAAIDEAKNKAASFVCNFGFDVERTIHIIEGLLYERVEQRKIRWYAVKLFERDKSVRDELKLPDDIRFLIENEITKLENRLSNDSEGIIVNARYDFITDAVKSCYRKNQKKVPSASEKIDRVATNRFAAFPIFFAVMFLVYFASVSTLGSWGSAWITKGVFGDGWHLFKTNIFVPGIPALFTALLQRLNCAPWFFSFVVEGVVGGVGAVLGFVPQMIILFIMLTFLEECGYMSRIAFVLDRLFRCFGLSGKSFIPMLLGTGCGVPGIMASRTIQNESDRRMTVITTTFMPCGAKLPVIAMIASYFFDGAWWFAPGAYFLGIFSVMLSGLILKKTRLFKGENTPFIMELPSYHLPRFGGIARVTFERVSSFVKRAGTVVLLSSVAIWALSKLGLESSKLVFSEDMPLEQSVLGMVSCFALKAFEPLGFGNVKAVVATIMGLVAKEEIVGVFGVLELEGMTRLSAASFLIFNLLCAPCFATMGAIRREMNSRSWTLFAIGYQTAFAYALSFSFYQFGTILSGGRNFVGVFFAFLLCFTIIYLAFIKKNSGRDAI